MITKLFIRISVFCEVSVVELQRVDGTLKCSGVINDKSKRGQPKSDSGRAGSCLVVVGGLITAGCGNVSRFPVQAVTLGMPWTSLLVVSLGLRPSVGPTFPY